MAKHKGISGKGTPGRDLESAADRQRETTGGINHPGTDINRESDQEATQGDWASGDQEGGTSLSIGDDHLEGPEQLDHSQGGPVIDTGELEALFEDVEFPCSKDDVIAAVERRGDDHLVSGVDLPALIAGLPRDRFMNPAELANAMREELERRAHPA